MREAFDYVVVGGGTAGCVLAERLSRDGHTSVALVEAGDARQSPWVPVPAGFSRLLTDPRHNWRLETEPETGTGGRRIAVPKGKGLGGSTLINGMIWVRGQPADYDGWAQRGCTGWSFADLLPVFRRMEDFDGAAGDPLRACGGPVPLTTVAERPAIAEAFLDAARSAGHPINPDYNGASQEGFGYYQVNQRGGRRVSAADAYLRPARKRGNLAILAGSTVRRIALDGRRATGVEVAGRGGIRSLYARREVILCAGAIHSPQILELSGVGDPDVLMAAGVPVRHALPGVGANYSDHFCTRMNWRVTKPVTLNEMTRGTALVRAVLRYALTRRGILTYGTGLAHGFMRTREGLAGPDVQLFFMHASYANAAERKLDRLPGMTIGVSQMRPESRGTIHLRGPDPDVAPAIRPNFLDAAEDRRCMVEGMKMTRAVIEEPSMTPFRGPEISPGATCRTDEDWLAFARENGQTIYHASGTCRMGVGPDAVVGPDLRVRGIDGLRVADASIMPTIVSGNIQAAVFAIAEKAGDLIASA